MIPKTALWGCILLIAGVGFVGCKGSGRTEQAGSLSFITAGDMRNFSDSAPPGKRYFDGACEAIQHVGGGAFMISPGDIDPPAPVRATLDRYLGTNYLWYPVVGNHEVETPEDMVWVRHWAAGGIPHQVTPGPPGAETTTYSFDFGNSHFIVLNEYYDGQSDIVLKGGLSQAALAWLESDLAATHKPLVWVVGHIPIQSLPDMDTQRVRHAEDTVSTNAAFVERFVQLLRDHHVRAYLCGHTHNASVEKVKGVWQVDSGHARGAGDAGAPSTFVKIRVDGVKAWVDVYRADGNGENYHLRKTLELD